METLDKIHGILKGVANWAVWIAGASLLFCALMVTVDVLFRKFFSMTMSGSDEISGYVFAASTTWAYSYCLLNRANVRIDVAYNFLPIRVRACLDIVGIALLLVYMGYLTRKAFDVFLTSWLGNSVSTTTLLTPLWIPQLAWFLGLLLFVITLTFMLLYTSVAMLRGEPALVQRVAGAMSAQEEIDQETHGLDVVTQSDNSRSTEAGSARADSGRQDRNS